MGVKTALQIQHSSLEAILQRLDAIIHELEGLRQIILSAQTEPPSENLTQKLFGILGQGKWEEYDDLKVNYL